MLYFSPQTLDYYLNCRITPWVAVPGLFILASQSWMTQVLVHGMVLPLLIFCKYQTCLRSYRPQTKFFAMWSLATFAFLFYIYQFHVVGILHWPKTVSPIENLCLMGNFFLQSWLYAAAYSTLVPWFLIVYRSRLGTFIIL